MRLEHFRDIWTPKPDRYSQTAFLSVARGSTGNYFGAYREFTPEASDRETRVMSLILSPSLNPLSHPRLALDGGEDPRCFNWMGRAWMLSPFWDGCDPGPNWLRYKIVSLESGCDVELKHDLPFAGKNWVPCPRLEWLYLVRSVWPLVVLRTRLDGRCERVIYNDGDIGEWRGGAAAEWSGSNSIIGFGHRTKTDPVLRHDPFRYRIDLASGSVDITEINRPDGDLVCDPTSLFSGKMICCCADKSWWEPQKITHRLFSMVQ